MILMKYFLSVVLDMWRSKLLLKIDLIQFLEACNFWEQVLKIIFMNFWSIFLTIKEAHAEPSNISKMKRVAKIVNGFKPLNVFFKYSILDVWLGPE